MPEEWKRVRQIAAEIRLVGRSVHSVAAARRSVFCQVADLADVERHEGMVFASRGGRLPPSDSTAAAGEQVFLAGGCAVCHTIGGTMAHATVGPDLTHFGSRLTIAAASLPNNRGNLGGWILDPQRIKPGAQMPPNGLDPDQLNAILAYLEGLK